MDILKNFDNIDWEHQFTMTEQSGAIDALEHGKLIYFPKLDFQLLPDETPFLEKDITLANSKNISYDSHQQKLKGTSLKGREFTKLQVLMQRFADNTHQLVNNLLPHYQSSLTLGRTSLRTVEVVGRKTSYQKDDTRLHVDAFPATPTQGKRILRVFSNINPHGKARVWHIGESFHNVAKRFLPEINPMIIGSAYLLKKLKITKGYRTSYDHYMLSLHNKMKKDMGYQRQVEKKQLELQPGTTWMVYTDLVSHAAISGQHLLEQTFYLPSEAMKNIESTPRAQLEKLLGKTLR